LHELAGPRDLPTVAARPGCVSAPGEPGILLGAASAGLLQEQHGRAGGRQGTGPAEV